jgi:hypothetical protein
MVTMADLSPASRAVLEALREAGWNWANDDKATFRDIASAVLRAAADQLVLDPEISSQGGMLLSCKDQLCDIATELDGIAKTES